MLIKNIMKTYLNIFSLLFIIFPAGAQTLPVSVSLSNIDTNTVITTSITVLRAQVSAAAPVTMVEFHAMYLDDRGDNYNPDHHQDKIAGQINPPERFDDVLLGADSTAPYEISWDVSDVPDQDGRRFNLWPVAVLKSGKRIKGPVVSDVVLDRNLNIPELSLAVPSEQPGLPAGTVILQLGTDSLVAEITHTREALVIRCRVRDRYIHVPCDTIDGRPDLREGSAYWNDCVLLMFDPLGNRSQRMDDDDFPILVSPIGRWYNHGYVRHNVAKTDSLADRIKLDLTVQGTLNNPADTDTGYSFTLHLPWELFGITPQNGTTIGFDISLIDRDGPDLLKNVVSWAGLVKRNRCNPTEWGRLVLMGKGGLPPFVYGAGLALLIILSVILRIRAGKKQPRPAPEAETHPLVRQTDELIAAHLTDPDLNINYLAKKLNTKSGYLGKLYKSKTGTGILDEIHRLRIEKADLLLAGGSKTVAEVGFEVGYNSPQYFIRTYKKLKGTTPAQSM